MAPRPAALLGHLLVRDDGGHVVYESRLELSRLILADFDAGTVGITAQPFLLEQEGRRHIPDFLLVDAAGLVTVVNVKPAERLARPKVDRYTLDRSIRGLERAVGGVLLQRSSPSQPHALTALGQALLAQVEREFASTA